MSRELRTGIDAGGTFTDLVMFDEARDRYIVSKVLTTPADPSKGVLAALSDAMDRGGAVFDDLDQVIHGTTLVTNAIIERKGGRVALLSTSGFRDAVEIGREHRFDLYDIFLEFPEPLAPRYLRFDVPERTLADGSVVEDLDEQAVVELTEELAAKGIEGVAVCFLHSFKNPTNERRARDAIERTAPGMRVSLSSEVAPEIREYERSSTTLANVYVQGVVDEYIEKLEQELLSRGFGGSLLFMLSSGGTGGSETAVRLPIRLLESGPAGGALAAASIGKHAGITEALSFDMGGTTAKLCAIEGGTPLTKHQFEVDRVYRFRSGSGIPVKIPVVDMIEIGAGGGSIAMVDALGLLKVGPRSAGADPGPACYGRGGSAATVTDADLVLGYLNPDFFLGGQMRLDLDAARAAIERDVAEPLGLSLERAAWGIHEIVSESMANAARVHLIERGLNPDHLPVIAFGGAGPVHACRVAQRLGSPRILVPPGSGVASAHGFLTAPLAFDFVRSHHTRLDSADWEAINELFEEMAEGGREILGQAGVPPDEVTHSRIAEMRYVGQGHELRITVPDGRLSETSVEPLTEAFEARYREIFGRGGPSVPLEVLSWRSISKGPEPRFEPIRFETEASGTPTKGTRRAYFPEEGSFIATEVYDRYLLDAGARIDGPAIIEERESTTVVPPGGGVLVDEHMNLIVEMPRNREDAK